MNKEDFIKHIPSEIWKQSTLIVGCSKCHNFLYVKKDSEYQEEEEKQLRELAEKNAIKCPYCGYKMNVLIEVGEKQ